MSTNRKRILFVDDEAAILASLSNLLRKDRHRWDLVFAHGGPEAARLLDDTRFDVIVTDMRMPDIDGAHLLELVRTRSPRTVRIMLSGHAESEAVIRALPLVHQFISKPCDIKTLRGVIERCMQDTGLDPDRSATSATGAVPGLPSHPIRYAELATALADPRCTQGELVAIVERDPAMAAKLLQIANTSYFGSGQAIASIQAAIATVGVEMIRELARSQIFMPARELAPGFSLHELCETAVQCARQAREVANPRRADEAYAVALLHELGRLVLAFEMPDRYGEVLAKAARSGRPLAEVEREELGVSQEEIRNQLFMLWALPSVLGQATAN
jgi:response regulator RpfG family c-di-GMP phosphodiesterase